MEKLMYGFMCRVTMAIAVVTSSAILAGCGGAGSGATPAPRSTSPSIQFANPATQTASPLPKAGDGTDLRACADGRCEVRVKPGDRITPPPTSGLKRLTITSVEGASETVTIDGRAPAGEVGVIDRASPGSPAHLNDLKVAVVAVSLHNAIIRITKT